MYDHIKQCGLAAGGRQQMAQESEVPLLQTMIRLQSIVLSCIDRKRFPFTRTQLSILTALSMEGELTMKQISRFIVSSQEQATRAVAPLADAAYVERRTDLANRTHVFIRLTERGKLLLEEYRTALAETLSVKLDRSLTEDERSALREASREMVRLMEKIR